MSSEKFHNADFIFDRLKELLGVKKDVELAALLKIQPNKLGVWRTRNFIPFEKLITLGSEHGVDIYSLLIKNDAPALKFSLGHRDSIREDVPGYGDDFVYIPQMEGRISAGEGVAPENAVEVKIAFRREWIERRGDPRHMSLIRVSGDSMEPTLQSGDLALIDHGRNYVDPQGGVYAISIDNAIMIKRVQVLHPSERVRIISDNPRYNAIETDQDKLRINGKVIWFGREVER